MKIAIDGPAGSGKSTIARKLSVRLGIPYLETGLAYRAAGFLVLKHLGAVSELSWKEIEPLLHRLEIEPRVGKTVVRVDGEELGEELKGEDVGRVASLVGTVGRFREFINEYFRSLLKGRQAVVEGRDAGTNIIPDAELKLFITASPEERAERRFRQLKRAGVEVSYEEILRGIVERDERDSQRKDYPFKPAPDAVIVDTTGKSVDEVIREIISMVERVRE
ncbi:(d)CMP kinase [Hydrogenivirga sp. 128-5-R1-1]|uniref:(d)CMP kinase n=1 Tax=Hydrogenivirga sp. 128-5-R1-1 TaxID=392423 RepID=UPI00015F35B9|nr:(d)CMP kinase [Hydrogenivirga sp. 128-5-R1-1]EDP76371.1 cytidylate kinase [Hydrogenivirga sp. 128-5-R1-1]